MAEQKTVRLERVFDAPVERVWAAWTDPELVAKWWGPKHFTSHDNKIDFKVGGKYVLCMHAPKEFGDQDMYSGGEYKEIVPMKKIVMTDNFMDKDGNVVSPDVYGMPADFPQNLLVTIEFEELEGGKTKLTLTHEGLPAGEQGEQAEAGWSESLDKLADSL
jgi:uncharacterized protein YndB with AHSA1/START domain